VSDETQDLAEAGHGQETAVLRVCNLPYLTQYGWCKLGALEELDGNLACYYAELLCVGLLEEILEDALFVWCEVEDGLVCGRLLSSYTNNSLSTEGTTYSIRRSPRDPPWLWDFRCRSAR
jgi:hypothetical protein